MEGGEGRLRCSTVIYFRGTWEAVITSTVIRTSNGKRKITLSTFLTNNHVARGAKQCRGVKAQRHYSLFSGRVDERAELLSYELTRGGQGSAILSAGGRAMYCTAPSNTSSLTSRRTLKLYAQPCPLGMRVPTGRYWVMYGVNCLFFPFLLYATVYFPI